ncbi:Glyoxylate/hydroxypyruvate reductase A [Ralstonia syzygii subsp. syzygii]|nr:Glyoxylate/hydroxypyruvate reductase A [Ralstonia syzygii subsp. syzygii]
MHIQIYTPDGEPQPWLDGFAQALPEARLSVWEHGAAQNADYAVVWQPPADMLRGRTDLRAVFNLGAGVDAILGLRQQSPDALPEDLPIVRLDDAGMAAQMSEYVTHAVLRFFRRLDEYERLQQARMWRFLKPFERDAFVVGVLGLGVLGTHIARTLAGFGFPVRGWSRSAKSVEGIDCRAGADALPGFLAGTRVLINVLPLTADTENVLDAALFDRLDAGAYLVNVARGRHLVEADLLAAVARGQIAGAALDVFRTEPLPADHPFWTEPRIRITPHISALTLREVSIAQIARKIRALEAGEPIAGIVDLQRGY